MRRSTSSALLALPGHGVSTLTKDQSDLLGALTLQTPTKHEQLTLL
jgi:hypothetical protein